MEGLFLLKNIDLFVLLLSLQYPEIHQHYLRIKVNRSISAIGRFRRLDENAINSTEFMIIYRHSNPKVLFNVESPGIQYAENIILKI